MGNLKSKEVKPEPANVYIFNRIVNNAKDVELLRKTFESLLCVVKEIQVEGKTLKELQNVVKEIVANDFTHYNYIVIVILDNENYDEDVWTTADRKDFHLNKHLMSAITVNKTLSRKLRFCILQTNRVPGDEIRIPYDPCECFYWWKKYYPGMDLKYYATSTGCALNHSWVDEEPSPFIEILCKSIEDNSQRPIEEQLTIGDLLNQVSLSVSGKTGETPSMVPISKPYVLGVARRDNNSERQPLNNRT